LMVGTVLGQACLRELASRIARAEFAEGSRTFSAATFLCAFGCVLAILPLLVFGDSVLRLVGGSSHAELNWTLTFSVAALGWAAQQFTLLLQSAVAATQRYASLAGISVLAALANVAAVVVAVVQFPTALGYLGGISAGLFASMLIWWVLARRALPWLFPLPAPSRSDFNAIVHFGKWQGLSHFVGALGLQMDRYVLGALAPLAVVGQYNVAMRLQEVVHMAVLKAGEVLFPHFSATASEPIERRASFFLTVSWVMNTLAACALAPLIPLAWDIIALWVNPATAAGAAPMLRSLAAAGVVGAGANVYFYFAMGTGQTSRLALLTVIHAITTVAMTIVLIRLYGSAAAGLGFLIASALRIALILPLTARSFGGSVSLWALMACTLPPLFAGLAGGAALNGIGAGSANTWAELAARYAAMFCGVAIACGALTSMTTRGRRLVGECLRKTCGMLLPARG
jgi:O-antigen/teichoic acid export membrane protein